VSGVALVGGVLQSSDIIFPKHINQGIWMKESYCGFGNHGVEV
jgi:hypothetical protein